MPRGARSRFRAGRARERVIRMEDVKGWRRRADRCKVVTSQEVTPDHSGASAMPATLRFIESYDTHSVYEAPNGAEVYLAHGWPRVELFDFTLDWALAEWDRSPIYRGSLFLDWLRDHVINPDDIDDALIICDDCGDPTDREESWAVGRQCDTVVCQSCMDSNYYTCHDCGSLVPSEDINSIMDEMVCDYCRDRSYSWCDECEEYYRDDYGCEGNHSESEGCDCESPVTSFAIRNDGEGMLRNDERVTVSLAAGVIDDEGMWAIRRALQGAELWSASTVVTGMDARWQTKDGNFTKRLSRAAYKNDGTKIPPAVLSQIGCIARDHSKPVDFSVAVTRELNMSAADFYHADSCWFTAGSYGDSRCALKSNGGFGLRSFGEYDNVSGRAWVMPLRKTDDGALVPTFDTEAPAAFVVFNGYGALEGYNAARIVSHMAGMTYRKVTFSCSPMYINSDAGYLVAPEDIAEGYTDGSLHLSADTHSDRYYRESNARETVNV